MARLHFVVLAGILIAITIIASGCDVAKAVLPKRCPTSCDDASSCTLDVCSQDTGFLCTHQEIVPCNGNGVCEQGEFLNSTDCPICDDRNSCTIDKYSYEDAECLYEFIPTCCGNSICEAGETTQSCAGDCPSCDDGNACTQDTYVRETSSCTHKAIFPCCGNNRCEGGERFATCSSDCPATKDDEVLLCGTNETCLTDVAVKYHDIETCASAASVAGTQACYRRMAVTHNRSVYCSYITNFGELERCQEEFAVAYLDIARCPITNPNNCIEAIAIGTQDASLCEGMTEQFVRTKDDFVLKCKASVLGDFLLCKGIQNDWIADKCYTELAVRMKDASLCSAVVLDRQSCEFYVEDAILGTPGE